MTKRPHNSDDTPKREKFEFSKMSALATSSDPRVRKEAFIEYFERFAEFPSYLFENNPTIDPRLHETIQDLLKDVDTPKPMLKGIEVLLERLPS